MTAALTLGVAGAESIIGFDLGALSRSFWP